MHNIIHILLAGMVRHIIRVGMARQQDEQQLMVIMLIITTGMDLLQVVLR
jgi:hypothetical protein